MAFDDLLASADVSIRAGLGSTVTYTPGVGDAVEIPGIFDAAYLVPDAGNSGVSSSAPAVFLAVSDLPDGYESDTDARVTAGGVEYSIHEVKPDGVGGVVLLLHEV